MWNQSAQKWGRPFKLTDSLSLKIQFTISGKETSGIKLMLFLILMQKFIIKGQLLSWVDIRTGLCSSFTLPVVSNNISTTICVRV